jgi:hypothetical protein
MTTPIGHGRDYVCHTDLKNRTLTPAERHRYRWCPQASTETHRCSLEGVKYVIHLATDNHLIIPIDIEDSKQCHREMGHSRLFETTMDIRLKRPH